VIIGNDGCSSPIEFWRLPLKSPMRAYLVLMAMLLATAGFLNAARADEPRPLPEALTALLREDRFILKVELLGPPIPRREGYQLGIYTPSGPGLTADDIQRLVKALNGVDVVSVVFYGHPRLLPLLGKLSGTRELFFSRGNDLINDGIDERLAQVLQQLPKLETLSVSDHELGNAGLREIAKYPKLRSLGISHGKYDAEGFRQLRVLLELRELSVDFASQLPDAVFADIEELKQLQRLRFMASQLRGTELSRLSRLEKLTELNLWLNKLTDEAIKDLAGCKHLRILRLGHNNEITDDVMATLVQLQGLEELDLSHTKFSDEGCARLARLPALARLDLSDSQVSDEGIVSLAGCKKLTDLKLRGRHITDDSVRPLCRLQTLRKLDVQDTAITPVGAQTLRNSFDGRCSIQSGKRPAGDR
jgi:Leucine-rich repeat (LRR) protein